MQTSDPDLVTKLSKEEPADPRVVTAAQGQLSSEDACVKTMGPLWVQGKGVAQGGQGAPPQVLSRTPGRECCMGRAEHYSLPNPLSTMN